MQTLEQLKVSDVAKQGLQFVDTDGASKILGVTEGTLVVWRSQRRYSLAYVKIGRKGLLHHARFALVHRIAARNPSRA